mmetsp:Transcript_74772/g.206244  ORF Transcript_74772/g.206244 Transcript_74772/m.206244 type:complete len:181 (-) Transcript_74772:2114-2656(-)
MHRLSTRKLLHARNIHPRVVRFGKIWRGFRPIDRECTGPCNRGHFCKQGSTSNTSEVCPRGRFNPDIGGRDEAACLTSPKGTHIPLEAAERPTDCPAGYHQPAEGMAECIPCPGGEYQSRPGQAACRRCDAGRGSDSGSVQCAYCAKDFSFRRPTFPGARRAVRSGGSRAVRIPRVRISI